MKCFKIQKDVILTDSHVTEGIIIYVGKKQNRICFISDYKKRSNTVIFQEPRALDKFYSTLRDTNQRLTAYSIK